VNSRTARATQRNPVSKNQKKKKKKKEKEKEKEEKERGWRDGSAVKSTDCSFRGPRLISSIYMVAHKHL
jgi:type IV secretory pathway VirB9-like protein